MSDAVAARTAYVQGITAIAVTLCLSVTGVLMFKVLPLMVGAAAESFSFGPQELGYIASSDLAGITLASMLAPLWARRIDWRRAAGIALSLVIVGNVVSAFINELTPLLATRLVTGIGEGMASSLALVILSDTRNPDRGFALAIAAPIFVGLLAFQALPPLVIRFGYPGVVLSLAVMAACFLLLTPLLPRRGRPAAATAGTHAPMTRGAARWVIAGLAGTTVYHVGLVAVWAFVERMGHSAGLAAAAVGNALGTAVIFGLAGSLIAAAVGARYGRLWPLLLAAVGQCAALFLLGGAMSGMDLTTATALFQLLWLMSVPYQIAVIASADASGRFFVLALACQAAGVTLGPTLAGHLIEGNDYNAVRLLSGVCIACGTALMAPLAVRSTAGAARTTQTSG